MKKKINFLKEVNKVYSEKNPSVYFRDHKKIQKFIDNRKNFLLDLKLPHKIFENSSLIDFGCGSGQNSITYDWLGANCTLIEFDKNSCLNAKKLFKKFSRNKYKIINEDIFKIKNKKKYDFVISNGVVQHTHNPKKNIKICCNAVKKGGFFILGIGEKNGFFQRNIQRLILYSISNNNLDVIKYSKILFKKHLNRSVKFGGRTIDEVIFDTYINPKIDTLSTGEIVKEFNKNKLILYYSNEPIKNVKSFTNPFMTQFKLMSNKKFAQTKFEDSLIFNSLHNLSLSNQDSYKIKEIPQFLKMNETIKKIVNKVNNNNNLSKLKNIPIKDLTNLSKIINKLKKIQVIDTEHNKIFIKEMMNIFGVLNSKMQRIEKYHKIKKLLKNSKKIFKGFNGIGMSYFVGYKPK